MTWRSNSLSLGRSFLGVNRRWSWKSLDNPPPVTHSAFLFKAPWKAPPNPHLSFQPAFRDHRHESQAPSKEDGLYWWPQTGWEVLRGYDPWGVHPIYQLFWVLVPICCFQGCNGSQALLNTWGAEALWLKAWAWNSLVVQWLRIRLPMQGTWVRSLVWEDPTRCRAMKPMCHNNWACALESGSYNSWRLHALEPVLSNKRNC